MALRYLFKQGLRRKSLTFMAIGILLVYMTFHFTSSTCKCKDNHDHVKSLDLQNVQYKCIEKRTNVVLKRNSSKHSEQTNIISPGSRIEKSSNSVSDSNNKNDFDIYKAKLKTTEMSEGIARNASIYVPSLLIHKETGKSSRVIIPIFQHRNISGRQSDKWIVVDYTSDLCAKRPFTVPPDWTLILISGERPLHNCIAPRCIIIDHEVSEVEELIQEPHLSLRNTAYLTAIANGADQILEADCRFVTTNALSVLNFTSTSGSGLMYNSTLHFNPYEHFGAWATVPRARKHASRAENNSRIYYVRDFSSVYVAHGLSDLSDDITIRDVDASKEKMKGLRFNPSLPPVFMGQTSFTSVSASFTLYHKPAFWGLLLPCRSRPHRCDIIRQYILQRLLRELDAFTGFYQVQAVFSTKVESTNDGKYNEDLFSPTKDFDTVTSYLDRWICKPEMTLFGCMESLTSDIVHDLQLDDLVVPLVQSWLDAIRAAKLVEPARVHSPWRGVRKVSEVKTVLGDVQATLEKGEPQAKKSHQKGIVDFVASKCREYNNTSLVTSSFTFWQTPSISDIVLIIVFNYSKYFFINLPYIETIHRPFFRHIVYCVPEVDELLVHGSRHLLSHLTLVEALSDLWYFMYGCVSHVASMNLPGVRGYIQIGDDTLINTWTLDSLPRDSIWLPPTLIPLRADQPKSKWVWWESSYGRESLLRAFSHLEKYSGLTSDQILKLDSDFKSGAHINSTTFSVLYKNVSNSSFLESQILNGSESWALPSRDESRKFLNCYIGEHKMAGRFARRDVDFFYVPQKLIRSYVTFSRFLIRHRVIHELAVPAIHYGIARKADIEYVPASTLWSHQRHREWEFYNHSIVFLHPLKMYTNIPNPKKRVIICTNYLVHLFSSIGIGVSK